MDVAVSFVLMPLLNAFFEGEVISMRIFLFVDMGKAHMPRSRLMLVNHRGINHLKSQASRRKNQSAEKRKLDLLFLEPSFDMR